MAVPQVLQGECATAGLARGFDRIANLLALTLGPTQGVILAKHDTRAEPETLTDAAMIARRIIALPNRAEDVGAMLARNLVWRMHVRAGDGCATAAVLAQAVLQQARRFTAAGGNPMLLRRGIDRATRAAVGALQSMACPVQGAQQITLLAQAITGEPSLSAVLGEVFGRLGPDAHIMIEDYLSPYLERQYYEGGRWKGRLVSPYFYSDSSRQRAVVENCHVVLYAGDVASVDDVKAMLDLIAATPFHEVALVAKEISGIALATLVLNHQQGKLKILPAVLRERDSKRQSDFDDIAVLTGATVLSPETGRPLESITPADVGAAPRVEADEDELVVVAGEGDQAAIQEQVAALRARSAALNEGDEELEYVRFRLARLAGQVAKLMIGAHSETERNLLREKATKAIRAIPLALRDGVVPGGGVAYLNCIPAVCALSASGDEAHGVQILARALQEPFRRIAANAGVDAPGAVMAEAQRRGPDFGWDAVSGSMVSLRDAGILDAASIARLALETAVSGAVMALTTETIVLKRNPQTGYEP